MMRSLTLIALSWILWAPSASGQTPVSLRTARTSYTDGIVDGGFGSVLLPVADLDGDGNEDLIVTSPRASSVAPGGSVRAIRAKGGQVIWTLPPLGPNERLLADSVTQIDDRNGDGIDELCVAILTNLLTGGASSGADYEVRVIDPTTGSFLPGSVFAGITNVLSQPPTPVIRPHADLDGDGLKEVLVTSGGEFSWALRCVNLVTGQVVLFRGGMVREPAAMATGRDVNQDGITDIVLGFPTSPGVLSSNAGRVEILSGGDLATLAIAQGIETEGALGTSVAFVEDFNADGVPDVVAGAPGAPSGAPVGRVFAIDGQFGTLAAAFASPLLPNMGASLSVESTPLGSRILTAGRFGTSAGLLFLPINFPTFSLRARYEAPASATGKGRAVFVKDINGDDAPESDTVVAFAGDANSPGQVHTYFAQRNEAYGPSVPMVNPINLSAGLSPDFTQPGLINVNGPVSGVPVVVVASAQRAALPGPSAGVLLIDPTDPGLIIVEGVMAPTFQGPPVAGFFRIPLPVPALIALEGVTVHLQAATLDATMLPVLSNGLTLTF